ncbi:monovalent cation/H+ antiporter subunit A, partial [Pseudomonas vancouverensis]
LPAIILATLCILVGILPALLAGTLVNSVTRASLAQPEFEGVHLAIWHGVNAPLLMSVIALIGGTLFYFALAKDGRIRKIDLDPHLGKFQGRILFDLFLKHLLLSSRRMKQTTENGSLQSYLLWIVLFSIVMVALPLLNQGLTTGTRELTHAPWV